MNVAANVARALAATAALVATAIASPPVHKGHQPPAMATPYAGQDARAIASLSAEDVAALLAGAGAGFAKSAELNGYPGPLHVLELADALKLAADQRHAVQASFDRMKVKAVEIGARYVAAEIAVDAALRAGAQADVADRVLEAEKLRSELRLAHLAAHIEITPLLTPEQRQHYARLRGYGTGASHDRNHKH